MRERSAGEAAARRRAARQEGLEPPTRSLEGCCSIHLSYWRRPNPRPPRSRSPRVPRKKDRGGPIRTADSLLPKQVRYQATLRPVVRRGRRLTEGGGESNAAAPCGSALSVQFETHR